MTYFNVKQVTLFFLCATAFSVDMPCHADQTDVMNLFAGRSETRDNNIFRLSDNIDPFPLTGSHERSDLISTSFVGFKLNKPIGLQDFHLGANYASIGYQNYAYLGSKTLDYDGSWQWKLTPELHGILSEERKQTPMGFANYQIYTSQNVVTTNDRRLNADWNPVGGWHIVTTLTDGTWINSQLYNEYASSKYRTGEGGAKYEYPSGTSIEVLYRRSFGYLFNLTPDVLSQYDTGYQQNDRELDLDWLLTGKSRLTAKLGSIDRTYDNFASRDYAGRVGKLSSITDVTGKILVTAFLERTYNSYQTSYSSYFVNDDENFQAKWISSPKLSVTWSFDRTRSDFLGEIVPSSRRYDWLYSSTLEVDWAPVKAITLIGNVTRQQRQSTLSGWEFLDTSSNLTLQFVY